MTIFQNKKVLITGHTGFKGFWLSLILKEMGAIVYGVSLENKKEQRSHFYDLEGHTLLKNYFLDIRNLCDLEEVVEEIKPNYIFHLAAQAIVSKSFIDPIATFTTNTIGSLNILEAVRKNLKNCIVVMITSDKVYENFEWVYGYRENDKLGGKDPYSASKASAEIAINSYYNSFLKNSPFLVATARAGNVIGGGDWSKDRLVPDCIRSWIKNEDVLLRSPNSTRPWQHVFDPLNGYLLLAEKLTIDSSISGESFNFGPDSLNEYNVETAVKYLSDIWGDHSGFKKDDKIILEEANLLKLNCDKSHKILNWKSIIDFKSSLEFTANWYKQSIKGFSNTKNVTYSQIEWFLLNNLCSK